MPSPLKKSFAAEQLKLRKKKMRFRRMLYAGILVVIVGIGGYFAFKYYTSEKRISTEPEKLITLIVLPDPNYNPD